MHRFQLKCREPLSGADTQDCGPPPVLSTENEKAYDDLTMQLLQIFRPRDFIELMYIRELADSTWEISRYTRHKTVAIDRKFRTRLEFQAKRDRARAPLKEDKARELAERNGEPATQLDRLAEVQEMLDCSVEDVDAILEKVAEEVDHARALEGTIDYYERLDKLIAAARTRRDSALEQFEEYSQGWGVRLWHNHHLEDIFLSSAQVAEQLSDAAAT